MLTIYMPFEEPPAPELLEPVMRDVNALKDEMRAARARVFGAGLHPSESAMVVRLVSVKAQGTRVSRRNWRAG